MRKKAEEEFLGIECGGTRTVALLADGNGKLLERREFGPANLRLLDDDALQERLGQIASAFPNPGAVGIGMAGARTELDRERIRKVASNCWAGARIQVTHDLEIALLAGTSGARRKTAVLVLSGTGSCCHGKSASGKSVKLGGWGHILGDKGSGYEIGLRSLKASVFYYDRDGVWGDLGQRILRDLVLNEPDDLIEWVQKAGKREIAALAPVVFAAAAAGDKVARDILEAAASSLARDAVTCARKLAPGGGEVRFLLAGSVLLKQPAFARKVGNQIKMAWKGARVELLEREGAWGAVALAMRAGRALPAESAQHLKARNEARIYVPPLTLAGSPTEKRNPRSSHFDQLSPIEGVRMMLAEEKRVAPLLQKSDRVLAKGADLIGRALLQGGRLFYAGAGTSGRLGVLDSSECPPTFRADPEQVQGIIAGGERALHQAVEGAEDDAEAGAKAVRFRGVSRKDVLVGIAASGRTPFVWGALAAARKAGAKTILLSFNPSLKIMREHRPDLVIAIDLGPEVLTGSTRLKCGTATKLVLNTFSTLAMVRQGKVIGNLMIDLNPSNTKLRDRAARIIQELTGVGAATALEVLERNRWVVKDAFNELTRKHRSAGAKASLPKPSPRRSGRAR